jgi:hypothetical protein
MKKSGIFVVALIIVMVVGSACTKIHAGHINVTTPLPGVAKAYASPDHPLNQYPKEVQESCEKIAEMMIDKGIEVEYAINKDKSCKVTPVLKNDQQSKFIPKENYLRGVWQNHMAYAIDVEFVRADKPTPVSKFRIESNGYKRFYFYPEVKYRWVVRNAKSKAVIDSGVRVLPTEPAYSEFAEEDVDCVRRTQKSYG